MHLFQGTIRSMPNFVTDAAIEHEDEIATLVTQYEQSAELEGIPDRQPLEEAHCLLRERLQQSVIEQEVAFLAWLINLYRNDWLATITEMRRYLSQPLPSDDRAWAWWVLVDSLALARQYTMMIDEQRAFIAWVSECFPPEQRLFTISDNTQGWGWWEQGMRAEWLERCEQLLAPIAETEATRWDRFEALRSAYTLFLRSRDLAGAAPYLPRLEVLLTEDPTWHDATEMSLEILAITIKPFVVAKDSEQLGVLGQKALEQWQALYSQWPDPSLSQRRCLRRLAHNLASSLYQGQRYDMALPLFERATSLHPATPLTYLWCAACVWVETHDTACVTDLLAQAQARDTAEGYAKKLRTIHELASFVV
jgi:tetratricopeptide (TPR) repeat protein